MSEHRAAQQEQPCPRCGDPSWERDGIRQCVHGSHCRPPAESGARTEPCDCTKHQHCIRCHGIEVEAREAFHWCLSCGKKWTSPAESGPRPEEEAVRKIRTAIRILDCGAHYCRYCPARSPEWAHLHGCPYVESLKQAVDAHEALRALLDQVKTLREELETERLSNDVYAKQVTALRERVARLEQADLRRSAMSEHRAAPQKD